VLQFADGSYLMKLEPRKWVVGGYLLTTAIALWMLLEMADAISSSVRVMKSAVFSSTDSNLSSPLRVTQGCSYDMLLPIFHRTDRGNAVHTRSSGIFARFAGSFSSIRLKRSARSSPIVSGT